MGLCLLTWVTQYDPFFWDTVQLASKHAHFFYENGLQWLPLPRAIDSGHPPIFGYYLAHIWAIFGKSLPVSHFAILPFLLLNVTLLWIIGRRLAGNTWGNFFPLLVLADPVLLSQCAMVSPDIVLVTGFLLVVEGVLGQRKPFVVVGVFLLCAISMRGMMTAGALAIWAVLLPFFRQFDWRKMLADALLYLPGFAFAAWFLWWHWQLCGWTGFHDKSPWAGAFKLVDAAGFLRNTAVLGWRWLDFGRFGEFIVLGGLFYSQLRQKQGPFTVLELFKKPIFSLLLCLVVFLSPSALLYQNLSAHRYFLPAFIALHLLVFQLITNSKLPNLTKKWIIAALVFFLLTGNLWRYPRGISMDWDSTLAHRSYHGLRVEALYFIDSKNISFNSIGSAFPNLNTGENLLLNGDQRQFAPMDFSQNKYILASNIFNDISGEDYAVLRGDWRLIWEKTHNGVWIEIYEKSGYKIRKVF